MSYKEISDDDVWTIPAERHKSKRPNYVPLSKAALTLIAAQPKFADCDYVFPSRAKDSIHALRQKQGCARPGCI